MSNKYIAVDILHYAKQLVEVSKNYAAHHLSNQFDAFPPFVEQQAPSAGLMPLTLDTAKQWLFQMAEDLVNARVMYATPKRSDADYIKLLFSLPTAASEKGCARVVSDFFKVDEVSDINVDLFNLVIKHVENKTWDQWSVLSFGNCIALISDRDYRVVEWENLTGYRGEDHHVLELDLSNVMKYLRDTVNKAVAPITMPHPLEPDRLITIKPGTVINFKAIIEDVLERMYPKISFASNLPLLNRTDLKDHIHPADIGHARLELFGFNKYDVFRDHFIKPAIESFSFAHLARRLDEKERYIATLDNFNILTIDYADASQWRKPPSEQTELEALAESLLAGDWLPERDRVRAERFITERGY